MKGVKLGSKMKGFKIKICGRMPSDLLPKKRQRKTQDFLTVIMGRVRLVCAW